MLMSDIKLLKTGDVRKLSALFLFLKFKRKKNDLLFTLLKPAELTFHTIRNKFILSNAETMVTHLYEMFLYSVLHKINCQMLMLF